MRGAGAVDGESFLTLGRYAAEAEGEGGRTAGALFTCSPFGPAIDLGLLVTFPPSLPASECEMPRTDCLILGQFSLAQAAPAVQAVVSCPVLTAPRSAVEQLRAMVRASAP